MSLPPRAADMWAASNDLRVYGRPEEYQVPMQMLGGGPSMADETGEVAFVYSFMASLEVSRGKPADSV
eukprot:161965-Prorocentrum_minimum.AAC.7